jgi:hypothetical protein
MCAYDYRNMRAAKNNEIEFEVYDEFLAIDLTEQKEFEEYHNRAKKSIKGRLKGLSFDVCIKLYCIM